MALEPARLTLRTWRDSDLAPFISLNADPEVMRFFPAPLSAEQTQAMVTKIEAHFSEHGYGMWAVERKDNARFIGFVGLNHVSFEAPFVPAVEIGWRLARAHWGHGYAPEAAAEVLRYAFETLGLPSVVSLTAVQNRPSRRVMEKIGMRHHPEEDFDHPRLEKGHWLERHVLYRVWPST